MTGGIASTIAWLNHFCGGVVQAVGLHRVVVENGSKQGGIGKEGHFYKINRLKV